MSNPSVASGQEDEYSKYIQFPLFQFLRTSYERWPFERLIKFPDQLTDIWICFITPWAVRREFEYEFEGRALRKNGPEERFTAKWIPFVERNFVFYTVVLRHFLKLAALVDFTHEDNLRTLLAVLKVFTPDLVRVIKEREHQLKALQTATFPNYLDQNAAQLPNHIQQLTGQPLSEFVGFTSEEVRSLASDLCLSLRRRYNNVVKRESSSSLLQRNQEESYDDEDTFGKIAGVDLLKPVRAIKNTLSSPFSPESKRPRSPNESTAAKLHQKLDELLLSVFELDPEAIRSTDSAPVTRVASAAFARQTPERRRKDPFAPLTDRGREQVRTGERVCSNTEVRFFGDVWDRPKTKFEFRILLNATHKMSEVLNRALYGQCTASDCELAAIGEVDEEDEDGPAGGRCWEHGGFIRVYRWRVNLRGFADWRNILWFAFIVWLALKCFNV